jgi:hypothetical protein
MNENSFGKGITVGEPFPLCGNGSAKFQSTKGAVQKK